MSKRRGFTLIELIVVISIIGILAAVVVPSLVDIGREARRASLMALEGALVDAVELTRGMYYAKGRAGSTVDVGNGIAPVAVVPSSSSFFGGQPLGQASGIALVVRTGDNFSLAFSTDGDGGVAIFSYINSSGDVIDNCQVTYNDRSINLAADPVISLVDSGC